MPKSFSRSLYASAVTTLFAMRYSPVPAGVMCREKTISSPSSVSYTRRTYAARSTCRFLWTRRRRREGGRVRKRRKRRRVFNRIEIEIERTTEDEIWAGGLLNDARRRAARVDARARGRAGGRSGRSTRTVGPDDGRELLERADDLMAFVRPASERGRDARARGGDLVSVRSGDARGGGKRRCAAEDGGRT
eukprot:31034-Pelagococcus_subviridis.AAC.12